MSSPRAQHVALSATLRRLRRDAGLSQVKAARTAGVTQAKISRLENGLFTPQVDDVRRLAQAYRAPAATRRELEQNARDLTEGRVYARMILQRGAWRMQQQVGRIEEASTRLRAFHPTIVPGLAQTSAYARVVFASKDVSGDDLDSTTDARINRQAILDTDRDISLIDRKSVV